MAKTVGEVILKVKPELDNAKLKAVEARVLRPFSKIQQQFKSVAQSTSNLVDKIRGGLIVGGIGTALSLVDAGFNNAENRLNTLLLRAKNIKTIADLGGSTSAGLASNVLSIVQASGGDASDFLDSFSQFQSNVQSSPQLKANYGGADVLTEFLRFIADVQKTNTKGGVVDTKAITAQLAPILGEDGFKKLASLVVGKPLQQTFSEFNKELDRQIKASPELKKLGITNVEQFNAKQAQQIQELAKTGQSGKVKGAVAQSIADFAGSAGITQATLAKQQNVINEQNKIANEQLKSFDNLADIKVLQERQIFVLQKGLTSLQGLVAKLVTIVEKATGQTIDKTVDKVISAETTQNLKSNAINSTDGLL